MYRIILSLFLLVSITTFSQDSIPKQIDSISAIDTINSTIPAADQYQSYQSNERTFNTIVEYQRQSTRKKKQQAYLYIGLGVFFLLILVISIVRRRKK
jgi:hypothetical protein